MNDASKTLTLFADTFWISPYVFSCFVSLREKGLDFSVEPVALQSREQDAPAYRDRTLTGRVPALRHGDFWLAESQAIVEYLDDAFPDAPRALPRDLEARARARQILAWLRSDLMPIREERSTATMFYERATAPLSTAGEAAAARLLRVAELLVPAGSGSLFGAWSQADSDLAFMLQRLLLNGHAVPTKVHAYAEREWQRPSVQEFVTHPRAAYVPY
ncbi:MAG: glutathione transferase [Byssovorax sp.]